MRFRAVTYGPFPGGLDARAARDFPLIRAAGFAAIRLFEMPSPRLLDEARAAGLRVFAGLDWAQNGDFFAEPRRFTAARVHLAAALRETGNHPALAGVFVANEIPADLVRWMGPARVREALELLISDARAAAPELLLAYANFPTTEYLEPANADFTAMNVYLESEAAFHAYLRRLHHIAGDRPVVISEFGVDSRRNGTRRQAEILRWADAVATGEDAAGFCVYAWSDLWWNRGRTEPDWDFGLTDRAGSEKPALSVFAERPPKNDCDAPDLADFTVIVCSRNGRARISACLAAIGKMRGKNFETILADDGSSDGTADHVARAFPWVRVLRLPPGGLSTARNKAAAAARGKYLAYTDDDCEPDRDWLANLARIFASGAYDAAGGPNLPPAPRTREEAIVAAAPGAPSHVMLDDVAAEHLPGCNLAVSRAAFDAIGGFDPRFHTAGDDVDFCWRLRAAGKHLGFAPGAFVWHHRRPHPSAFLRQQIGYGIAEKMLMEKHPGHFSARGDARWQGFVYGGGPVRVHGDSVIYHGPQGNAPYQHIITRMLPLRGLAAPWDDFTARWRLCAVTFLVPLLRRWARCGILVFPRLPCSAKPPEIHGETSVFPKQDRAEIFTLFRRDGWLPSDDPAWDLTMGHRNMIAATERFDDGTCRTLVRISG